MAQRRLQHGEGLIQLLENHANDAEGHPEVQSRIPEHIETTRRHADRVEECIQRLGGDTSSLKAGMANISGTLQGMVTGTAEDVLVKNAITDYAGEQFEVASYRSLITAAEELGDQETVPARRTSARMRRWPCSLSSSCRRSLKTSSEARRGRTARRKDSYRFCCT